MRENFMQKKRGKILVGFLAFALAILLSSTVVFAQDGNDNSASSQGDLGTTTASSSGTQNGGQSDKNSTNSTDNTQDNTEGNTQTQNGSSDNTASTGETAAQNGQTQPLAAPAAAGDPPTGLGDEGEPYAVPAGSAHIKEIGADVSYANDATGNAIQKAVADAITYAQGVQADPATGKKTVTVVVADGLYQGGLDLSVSSGGTFADLIADLIGQGHTNPLDNIQLNIVAHDALDANGNPTANSAGDVQVEGGINVEGLDVLLAGLYLALQGDVNASNMASFGYYGTKLDDNVKLQLENIRKTLTVDGGAGDDTLDVSITQAPNLELNIDPDLITALQDVLVLDPNQNPGLAAQIGQLLDLLNAMISGNYDPNVALNALIKGGDGNDDIKVHLKNSTALSLGLNETGYGLKLDLGRTIMDLQGDGGSDEISVTGGLAGSFDKVLTNAILQYAVSQVSSPGSEIRINGGAGDDLVTVDTTTAFSSFVGMDISVEGGGGYDRLHLTGKLDKDEAPESRIIGDVNGLFIKALAEMTFLGGTPLEFSLPFRRDLNISLTGVEAVTDQLANKRSVNITQANGGAGITAQSFTDYVLAVGSDGKVNFSSAMQIPAALFLATLIVNGQKLTINQLLAAGFNILITGEEIDIVGVVAGRNVLLLAYSTDTPVLALDVELITDDLDDDNDMVIDFGLYDADAEAKINIGASAKITADEAVYLSAVSEQNKPFIPEPLADSFNLFTLKLGKAILNILGQIDAAGTIWGRTLVSVVIDATNELLAVAIPLAVGAASTDSLLTIGGNAKLSAGAGVKLSAGSGIKITSESTGGVLKFSLALAVVEANTHVNVGGNAVITSGGDVSGKADSRVSATAAATGKKPSQFADKASSGVFVAVSVIVQETSVTLGDAASVYATGGVDLYSSAILNTSNVSVAIPDEVKTTPSLFQTISLVKKLMGTVEKVGSGLLSKAQGLLGGDKSPEKQIEQGTSQAKPEGQTTSNQLVGALAVSYVENENRARVTTSGAVEAGGALNVRAFASTYSYARADGSLYKTPPIIPGVPIAETPDNAIGVAITVVVFGHTNEAYINKGNIRAEGISVSANSGLVASLAISKAGHVPMKDTSKIGLGGAITVQVLSVQNHATIGKGAGYGLTGGKVSALAGGKGWFVTVADASGKRSTPTLPVPGITIPLKPTQTGNADSVGIGAGIAVGILGIDVSAVIEDGVIFEMLNGAVLDSLTAEASFTAKEEVDASAGAAGGTSVVPVLALNVSGQNVEATVGTSAAGKVDEVKGDIVVKASSTIERNLTANAAAVGTGVGIGAAFGIAIVNDSAEAKLKRSVTGKNVYVDAKSISRMKETIKASAKGAKPQPSPSLGSGDAPGGGTQGGIDDLTEGGDPGSVPGDLGSRFDDEAAEADKFADKNTQAASQMAGQVNSKNVNSNSVNNLVKDRQRAQTNEGNVQVAAAFALNIQKNVSFAYIGDGLVITARPENGSGGEIRVQSLSDTDASISANASATNSIEGVGVGVAINIVTYENKAYIGDSRLNAASLVLKADIVEAGEKRTVEEILTDLFAFIADMYDLEHLVNALQKFSGSNQSYDELIAAELAKANPEALPTDPAELAKTQKAVKDQVAATLTSMLTGGQVGEVAGTVIAAVAQSLVKSFLEVLTSEDFILSLLFPSQSGETNPFQFIVDKIALTGEVAAKRIRAAIATALTIRFGSDNELDNMGNKISTTAISGVGASNVGVAGSAAITVVNGYTEAVFGGRLSLLDDDIDITGDVVISAESAQKVYTTATASADKKGMPNKNKSGTGDTKQDGSSVGVGASAAVSVINVAVNAGVGDYRNIKAATLSIIALLQNDINTISVAGSDPIARRDAPEVVTPPIGTAPVPEANNTTTKDIAVDASAAVGLIANEVRAYVGTGAKVKTFGANTIETGVILAGGLKEMVSLYIMAGQKGETYTSASGFAVGEKAAVGAAVAVNLAASEVNAEFLGNGEVAGDAKVHAYTFNKDEASALATVVGASIDRYLDYLRNLQRMLSIGSHPPTGAMNAKIVNKLNTLANPITSELRPGGGGPKAAATHVPLLSAVLAKLNVVAPGTPDTSGATNTAQQNSDTSVSGQDMDKSTKDGQAINIAAAVAANITKHNAKATITGSLKALVITLLAENHSNYRTLGTGAAVTGFGDKNANNISVGVAVTVNGNSAETYMAGEVTAEGTGGSVNPNGDIRVESNLTQNMDEPYVGLLGAQALAGSVAASGGKVGVAGALAVMVAEAKTKAVIGANAIIQGGNITLLATDKSKFAVRAGGITITGAKVGIGGSFALIYARSETTTEVQNGAQITASKSFTAKAQRLEVNSDDYKFPFDEKDLFTVNATDGAEKGLINLNIKTDSSSSSGKDSVELNLGVDDLLKLVDMLNYLSMVNYYIESIAGSVVVGQETTLALAGAISLGYLQNITESIVGDNVIITVLNGGKATVEASSDGKARLIGGAVTFTTGKAAVGVNVSGMYYDDEVTAQVGKGTAITAPGGIDVKARAKSDIWAVTAAASVTTGIGVGGNLNVILPGNKVIAQVLDGQKGQNGDPDKKTTLTATNGTVNITAENISELVLISASVALAIGSKASVGGTLAVVVTNNGTTAAVGSHVEITAQDITVSATSRERLINILASLSGSTGSVGVAGTLGVLVSLSDTLAKVGNYSALTATSGNIQILAEADVWQIVIMAAIAASGGNAAVGATVNVGVFNRNVEATVGEYTTLTAGGNIIIQALGKDWTLIVTMAGGLSSGTGVSGTIPVVVTQSHVKAELGAHSKMIAEGTSAVIADHEMNLFNIAGNVAVGGSNAIGATVSTLVLNNSVTAQVGDYATVIGKAAPAASPVDTRGRKARRGVVISATAEAFLAMVSVSGSAGGSVAVAGVVNTLVATNQVKALVGDHVAINADPERNADGTIQEGAVGIAVGGEQDVLVEASDDSEFYNIAGGLAVGGGSAGVGATVVVMVYNKVVAAAIGSGKQDVTNSGVMFAARNVLVAASSKDRVVLAAVSFAAAATAAVTVGGNVLVFGSEVTARLGGKVNAGGDVRVQADSDANLWNILASASGSGTAAVTPVAVVTYFEGSTIAAITRGADIYAGGLFSLLAKSEEFITADVLGATGSGVASVSGALDLIITTLVTKAYIEDGASALDAVKINALSITIDAQDKYTLIAVAAGVAISGTAAVTLTALITIVKNTVVASVGNYARLTSRGTFTGNATQPADGVFVKAESQRDIIEVAGSVAGGQVGVGVTLMVVVVGGKLTQDVADELDKGFDPVAFIQMILGTAHSSSKKSLEGRDTATAGHLKGDGARQSETRVGQDDGSFDGTGGYYSEDFQNGDYDDEGDTGRGQNQNFDGTNKDLEDAAGIGSQKPEYETEDTTSAYIGKNAIVTSAGDIVVSAVDVIVADLITATVAVGAYAGVGVGIAVAVLFSNVLAYVDAGTQLSAGGDILISAWAGSNPQDIPDDENTKKVLEENLETDKNDSGIDPITFLQRTIRVVSITGSGGVTGVSGAIASLTLVSNVKAWLAGDVTKANNLTISAAADYPLIVAVTLALSLGLVAVNASVALAVYLADVEASISGSAKIDKENSGTVKNVTVGTNVGSEALAVATAFSGGLAAVNGAVAVVVNRTRADAFIGQGVNANATGNVSVTGTAITGARAFILGVAVGGMAIGVSAAVVVICPTVLSYIGGTPGGIDPIAGASGSGGKVKAKNIYVKNNIVAKGQAAVISMAAGGTAGTGSALLVFNRTKAYAAINRMDTEADESINIDADMDSEASSFVLSVAAGGFTIGITVSYVQLRAENIALIDFTGVTIKAPVINVYAGREANPNIAKAEAIAVAGDVGLIAVGMNAAIADNAAKNLAQVVGGKDLTAATGLNVYAYGKAVADATIYGLAFSGIRVAANFVIALLRSEQEASVKGGNLTVGGLTVESHLNKTAVDDEKNTSIAKLVTGGGSLISLTASVAVAYGRSRSSAIVKPTKLTVNGGAGSIKIGSYGNAGVLAQVTNLSFEAISASLIFGFAYAQGVFEAELNVPSSGTADADVTAGAVTVETDYLTRGTANVVPSAGGVSASYITAKFNLAIAIVTSKATAKITGSGKLSVGNINVLATGTATAQAIIQTPKLSVGVASIVANLAIATLGATQTASIENVNIAKAGVVNVTSTLNNGANEGAVAQLGGNGSSTDSNGDPVSISLVNVKANSATPLANATNTATIKGASIEAGGKITVKAVGKSYASATTPQDAGSVSYIGIGVSVLYAKANGTYKAIIDTTGAEIAAPAVDVLVDYTATAYAKALQPDGGITVDISLYTVKTNVADAIVEIIAEAGITGTGKLTASGAVNVKATGTAKATAEFPGTTFSGSVIRVAVNVVTANVAAKQSAYIENATVNAGSLNVTSEFNQSHTTSNPLGAFATVGSSGGGSVSLVGGEVSTGYATMSATVKAYTKKAALDIAGALNVTVLATSYAKAGVSLPGAAASVVNVSVLKTKADAAGSFEAFIETAENQLDKAFSVNVDVTYTAHSEAASNPAGSLSLSVASSQTNLAQAFTGVVANAAITGSGEVETTGANGVTVKVTGTAKAQASIGGTNFAANAVKVAVNIAEATVNATQNAYIQNAKITATRLTVHSLFNLGHTASNPLGAIASVGSNGSNKGVNLTLVGGDTSKATATMRAIVKAYTKDIQFDISGAVDVLANAISYANADVLIPAEDISLANVTVLLTSANAAGTFEAGFALKGENNKAAGINVLANYKVISYAASGPAGGLSAGVLNASINKASANTGATATASFGGSGSAAIAGSLFVRAVGTGSATAEGRTRRITISAVRVALNRAEATLDATQSAYVDYAGTMTIGGRLTVESLFGTSSARGGAAATVGGSAGGADFSVVGVTTNVAVARSRVTNKAYIKGGGKITANSVLVNAATYTSTSATTKTNYGVGLATFGGLEAYAYGNDNTTAYVESITIITTGGISGYDVDITARNDTLARAFTENPGDVAVIVSNTAKAVAYVGESGQKQYAGAYIGDNANITAQGNIRVYAFNQGDAKADSKGGTSYGLVQVSDASVPTYAWYDTYAGIGNNSVVKAGGTLTVKAEDYAIGESIVRGNQIGFLAHVSTMYGNNNQDVVNRVNIGSSKIYATGEILIEAYSRAQMYALTDGRSGGFYTKGTVIVQNNLTRSTTVNILAGAFLESDYGALTVRSVAGSADSIRAYAYANGSGFVALGKSQAKNVVVSTSTTEVYAGATLRAPFGNLFIHANASMGLQYAYAFAFQSGAGTEPNAAVYNDINLKANVLIGQRGSGIAKIVGSYVDIRSFYGIMNITSESYSRGRGLGANVDARSDVNFFDSKVLTKVSNAEIRGYKQVNIYALAEPSVTTQQYNVVLDAFGYIQAIGDTTAATNQSGSISVETYLGANVVIYTADARVDALIPNVTLKNSPHTKRSGIASAHDNREGSLGTARYLTVNGVQFYLGDGAAGVLIDIDPDGRVRTVGLVNPSIVQVQGDKVTIGHIANPKPGKLYIGYITGNPINYEVFGQDFLLEVIIINRSTRNLVLEGITLQNANYVLPSITHSPGQGPRNGIQASDLDKEYVEGKLYIRVETRTTANVHVEGLISNRWSDVVFTWTGEKGGDLTSVKELVLLNGAGSVAPVWAHRLTISGAEDIGDKTNRFAAYLFVRTGRNANANVTATGDLFIALTPAVFEEVTAIPSNMANTPPAEKLYVEKITTGGNVDLLLADAQRIYGLKGGNTISIQLPGSLQYITDGLRDLAENVTLSKDGLARYLVDYDPVNDLYIYLLPNGTKLYLDKDGKLLRVIETMNGVTVDTVLGNYSFFTQNGDKFVQLGEGVLLNLTNGLLSIEKGYEFDALLEAIDGSWIVNNVGTGDGQFMFTYFYISGYESNGDPIYQISEGRLYEWFKEGEGEGTKIYYYVGEKPSNTGLNADRVYYVLCYDLATKTLSAFELEEAGSSQSSTFTDYVTNYATENGKRVIRSLSDGNNYYLLTSYAPLVIDKPDWYSFVDFGGIAGLNLDYRPDGAWDIQYKGSDWSVWDSNVIFDNGIYYIKPNATHSNSLIQTAYDLLKGLFWTVEQDSYNAGNDLENDDDDTVGVCYPTGETSIYYVWRWGEHINNRRTRWYDVTYWRLAPVSLYIAPAVDANGDEQGYYLVDFYAETDGNNQPLTYSNVSVSGKISDIPLKKTSIPNSSEEAYRITNQMYVSTTGNGIVVMVEGSFRAQFDGTNYISTYTCINNVAAPTSVILFTTAASGKQVMLEQLTNDVAVDVQGRYYVLVNGSWILGGTAPAPTTSQDTITLPDGSQITVTVETIEYSYGGKVWLKTQRLYNTAESYELIRYYVPQDGSGSGAYIQIDSNGNTVFPGDMAETQKKVAIEGSTYLIGNLAGDNVTVTMTEAKGSMVDGRTGTAESAPNIVAQNDITFVSNSSGSIGTEAVPLEIVSVNDTGLLWLYDLLGNQLSLTNTWLYVPQYNLSIATDTTVAGKVLWIKTKVGSISFGRLAAKSEGTGKATLTLDSAKGITGEKLTATGSVVIFQARDGDIEVEEIETTESELDFDASGSITSGLLTAKGGKVTFKAGKDILVAEISALQKANLIFTAGGDILVKKMLAYDSAAVFTATGAIEVLTLDAQRSGITFTTTDTGSGDIRYDIIELVAASLILRANGGGIYPLNKTSYLWADADSSIRLRAKNNIGTPGVVMVVDIPASLVLWVERVKNYYIDAVELVGDAFERVHPTDDIRTGTDENDEEQTGEYLNDANIQFILFPLDKQTPEEITEWITDMLERDVYSQLITEEILAWLVEEGFIDLETLTALLTDDTNFTEQDLIDLLDDDTDPDRFAKVAGLLAPILAVPVPDEEDPNYDPDNPVIHITDDMLAQWLQQAIKGSKVQDLADVLISLIPQDLLQELVEKAWKQRDYEENADPPAKDGPSRAFYMTIEFSDGTGYVNNRGDIYITQLDGNLTAGLVYSVHGDIYLRAEKGSILGDAASALHVDGRYIGLWAGQDIGSPAQPLVTQQRQNRPCLIAEITTPAKDGNGDYIPVLRQEQVVDENGDLVWDIDGDPLRDEKGDPILDIDGNPVYAPVLQWVLVFEIAYRWIRLHYTQEATRLNATAGGSIYVTELEGDFGIGVVCAAGDVVLATPDGTLYDRREENETRPNVQAGGNATLLAPKGTIGLITEFIITDVGGQITAVAGGDIHIDDLGGLALQADSENGQIYAQSQGDMVLWNTADADLVIGYALAGGNVTVVGRKSVIQGDKLDKDVWVRGVSVSITALDGTVGTTAKPMLVDTDAANGGTLSASATGQIYLVEFSGDVTVGIIKGGRDVTLVSPGKVTDASAADLARMAAEAAKQAADFQANVDAVSTMARMWEEYLANGRFAFDTGLAAVQEALNKALAEYNAALKTYDDAVQQYNTAIQNHAAAQQEYGQAGQEYYTAVLEEITETQKLTDLQNEMDQLLQDPNATQAEIDELQAKIDAQQKVLEDLQQKLDDLQAKLDALQKTLDALQAEIDEQQQQVDKLWQTLQDKEAALVQATADMDQLNNLRSLIEALVAYLGNTAAAMQQQAGLLWQQAAGAKQAAQNSMSITAAGNLVLRAGGDIGEAGNALGIHVGGILDARVGNSKTDGTYLESDTSATFRPITAKVVEITALGDIAATAGAQGNWITADSAVLNAIGGNVGTNARPFLLSVKELSAQGENVVIINDRSLQVNSIVADYLNLTVNGNITAGIGGVNIAADRAVITASGNLGASGALVVMDVNELYATARNMYLGSLAEDLHINRLSATGHIEIRAWGKVWGANITAQNLDIIAVGDVGRPRTYLTYHVTGSVRLISILGWVYGRNTYTKPVSPVPQPGPEPGPQPPPEETLRRRIRRTAGDDGQEGEGEGGNGGGKITPVPILPSPVPTPLPEPDDEKDLLKIIITIIIIFLLFWLLIFLILWFKRKKEEEEPQEESALQGMPGDSNDTNSKTQ